MGNCAMVWVFPCVSSNSNRLRWLFFLKIHYAFKLMNWLFKIQKMIYIRGKWNRDNQFRSASVRKIWECLLSYSLTIVHSSSTMIYHCALHSGYIKGIRLEFRDFWEENETAQLAIRINRFSQNRLAHNPITKRK